MAKKKLTMETARLPPNIPDLCPTGYFKLYICHPYALLLFSLIGQWKVGTLLAN